MPSHDRPSSNLGTRGTPSSRRPIPPPSQPTRVFAVFGVSVDPCCPVERHPAPAGCVTTVLYRCPLTRMTCVCRVCCPCPRADGGVRVRVTRQDDHNRRACSCVQHRQTIQVPVPCPRLQRCGRHPTQVGNMNRRAARGFDAPNLSAHGFGPGPPNLCGAITNTVPRPSKKNSLIWSLFGSCCRVRSWRATSAGCNP